MCSAARRSPPSSLARASVAVDQHVVRRLFLYTVREGKLAECWLFDEDQRLIDSLWSEPLTGRVRGQPSSVLPSSVGPTVGSGAGPVSADSAPRPGTALQPVDQLGRLGLGKSFGHVFTGLSRQGLQIRGLRAGHRLVPRTPHSLVGLAALRSSAVMVRCGYPPAARPSAHRRFWLGDPRHNRWAFS